jgi:hypothetical protein
MITCRDTTAGKWPPLLGAAVKIDVKTIFPVSVNSTNDRTFGVCRAMTKEGSQPCLIKIAEPVRLPYHKIRDCTTPEEETNGAKTYFAALSAADILKDWDRRESSRLSPRSPRQKRNMVHKAIAKTIMEKPDRFSQFNSGFLIGASKIEVDDKIKIASLWDASINNGAQSRGEIRRYIEEECQAHGKEPHNFNVRAEISVEPDPLMRTEIAIARNTGRRSRACLRPASAATSTTFQPRSAPITRT